MSFWELSVAGSAKDFAEWAMPWSRKDYLFTQKQVHVTPGPSSALYCSLTRVFGMEMGTSQYTQPKASASDNGAVGKMYLLKRESDSTAVDRKREIVAS